MAIRRIGHERKIQVEPICEHKVTQADAIYVMRELRRRSEQAPEE
jgi:hypothetical protein